MEIEHIVLMMARIILGKITENEYFNLIFKY